MKKSILTAFLLILGLTAFAAAPSDNSPQRPVKIRVVIDNDFCGDPDGLFQLAHQLLCSTCEIRGIVGGHLAKGAWFGSRTDYATLSCEYADTVLELMGMKGKIRVVPGAEAGMTSKDQPIESEGARLIVEEANKCTHDKPLFILCGASLTNVASAHLMDPTIDDKVIIVWIGGQEYGGISGYPPPHYSKVEYNLNLSIPSGQVVFNNSSMRVWQIPRDAYRQCIYGIDEVKAKIKPYGKIGKYLYDQLMNTINVNEQGKYHKPMGEVYVMGDSPLVLLSALQTGYEPDPASSDYKLVPAPMIRDDGSYVFNPNGRLIRVYTRIDTRLMFGDLEAKMMLQ